MLKETFVNLLSHYSKNDRLIGELWTEVENSYNGNKRYYHTLKHLENLLLQLSEVKSSLLNWDVLLFSLYYHDIIYSAVKSNNEEKSAELAGQRMASLGIAPVIIEHCKTQILATKAHQQSDDDDTNYFLDADLSILGQPWERYADYYKNVRKEYAIYPDLIYKPGRKKVLQHFLAMPRIFKTEYFYQKLETSAKENLSRELALL